MPTIADLNDLNLKIANAKAERDAFAKSIDPNDSNSWWVSLQKNCGVTWTPNTIVPACSSTFQCTGAVDCRQIWHIITSRKQKIAEDDANILLWQGQVDALMKDPSIAEQIKTAETKRKLIKYTSITVVSIVVIVVSLWLWKKYQ